MFKLNIWKNKRPLDGCYCISTVKLISKKKLDSSPTTEAHNEVTVFVVVDCLGNSRLTKFYIGSALLCSAFLEF